MTDDDKSTEGNQPYEQPEATQAERKRILKQDAQSQTYFDIARGDDGDGRAGTPVVGSASPAPFVAPEWSRPVVPPEPPLGWCVDSLPDMRTRDGDNLTGEAEWEYGRRRENGEETNEET